MTIFIITFGFFLVIGLAMAVGYIFQKKELAGSCGGLADVGIEKECDCDNPCSSRLEREAAAKLEAEQKLNANDSISVKNI
ncbi:(Na+)-NQR maturation NqrM [Litorilituus sediminis]|uniref:(Na+)-NQR maturation NqrM n=1 Tax=Litorilituus sediminis TaxID=718192 RepID=A0A4P6P5W3_9GAMM|nr:(Na+)-NQR maturation NqrM [Litorilituus sediminis]QBG37076.1 (Na+)-NQR maturation NqrM [Litorilituus sediminis]